MADDFRPNTTHIEGLGKSEKLDLFEEMRSYDQLERQYRTLIQFAPVNVCATEMLKDCYTKGGRWVIDDYWTTFRKQIPDWQPFQSDPIYTGVDKREYVSRQRLCRSEPRLRMRL